MWDKRTPPPKRTRLRRLVLYSAASGLLTFIARADRVPLLSGVGQLACGQVAADAQKPGISGELAKHTFMAWVQGYLAVLNVMQSQKQTPVTNQHPSGFGVEEQWTAMVTWCQGHPGQMYVEAVDFLVGHLDDLSR